MSCCAFGCVWDILLLRLMPDEIMVGLMHVSESLDFPNEARARARQAMLQMLGLTNEEV